MCTNCQYTYVYAQSLLHSLCRSAGSNTTESGIFKRLSEELENYAINDQKQQLAIILLLNFCFSAVFLSPNLVPSLLLQYQILFKQR